MAASTLLAELDRVDRTLRKLEDALARICAAAVPEAPAAPAAAVPEAPAAQLFARAVELDVGPFADFDELSEFERTLGGLADVDDVYVRRFFGGRAIVEIAAARELPLLDRLAGIVPGGFAVDYAERDALRITLSAALVRGA
jgi:hypothetical protein